MLANTGGRAFSKAFLFSSAQTGLSRARELCTALWTVPTLGAIFGSFHGLGLWTNRLVAPLQCFTTARAVRLDLTLLLASQHAVICRLCLSAVPVHHPSARRGVWRLDDHRLPLLPLLRVLTPASALVSPYTYPPNASAPAFPSCLTVRLVRTFFIYPSRNARPSFLIPQTFFLHPTTPYI